MYFSIDFYNADNWKEENKLYFENAKELLRYQLEQLLPVPLRRRDRAGAAL